MDGQFETVSVTVRRLRVIDRRNRDRMWDLLLAPLAGSDERAQTDLWNFINLVNTTDVITGVDFQIPDPDAGFDVLEEAWHKYEALDEEVVKGWIKLHNQVNQSPNERRYLPPDKLSEDEKKSGQTSEEATA